MLVRAAYYGWIVTEIMNTKIESNVKSTYFRSHHRYTAGKSTIMTRLGSRICAGSGTWKHKMVSTDLILMVKTEVCLIICLALHHEDSASF